MKRYILLLVLLGSFKCFNQMPIMVTPGEIQPVSIQYGFLPDLGGTEITNYRIDLNMARPVGKSIIGFNIGYQYYDFVFDESTNVIDLTTYENMHVARVGLSFIRPLKNSWGLMLMGGTSLMSNLGNGVGSEDFVFNSIGAVTKRWGNFDRNTVLMLGVLYGTQLGEPTILPAVSLRQKLNEHWSYSLGLPITGINYSINDRHLFTASLMPEGLFGNNSNEVAVEGNRILTNTKLQFNGINASLAYRLKFAKNLALTVRGGFVPAATLKVLDDESEEIYDLDPGSGAYFRVGLNLVLNRKQLNKNKKSDDDEQ
ncbi:DUF6268 family outer membrane beta-barrel protein [Allomuricauda sp. SCSIO 65647]|uniref:DUF6268 family outer membrane beta-barrel protein n=1 Tax=Allomuricauda sp. SCSIO 65647 TaxID=2908843 RepID=UPI001F278430|nr:DUF6268 family outer membrane beta-barrel protein [Muricauda sp. SCSIO 65647]UJH69141.1 DUF6268 family outer membrane beta-barrel protein [Muricauda sp. SCSIO 65647]